MFGASSNHAICVLSSILSFALHFPYSSIVFVDYGLKRVDTCRLTNVYRILHDYWRAIESDVSIYNRVYNWSSFPEWMNINAMNHGGYTWKPISIADVFYQWKGVVLWNDASNLYNSKLLNSISIMRNEGIYIPRDLSSFESHIHRDSYSFLIEYGFATPFNYSIWMGRANQMLFDYNDATCRLIMVRWIQCAYTRRCMTLIGVGKDMHLPEQGALSAIMLYYHKASFFRTPIYPTLGHENSLHNVILTGLLEKYSNITKESLSVEVIDKCLDDSFK